MDTLGQRLAAARDKQFVGREEPLRAFAGMLTGSAATRLLWVQGPGGIGKSTLLAVMADRARAAGADVRMVDASGWRDAAELTHAIATPQGPGVAPVFVLVDGVEAVGRLAGLLRDQVLGGLPADSRVVLACRLPPDTRWRADLGWGAQMQTCVLGSFDRAEVADLLARRGLPAEQADQLHAATSGYPLAVALAVQLLVAGGAVVTAPGGMSAASGTDAAALLRDLLGRMLDGDPDAGQWQALQVLAVARQTTVDVLASSIDVPSQAAFDWLAGLSFVSAAGQGLQPHEIARAALLAELGWRAPEIQEQVRSRIHAHARARLQGPDPGLAQVAADDLLHLHRSSPVLVGRLGPAAGGFWVDQARDQDYPAVLSLVEGLEGAQSAALHAWWWQEQPEAFLVVRDAEGCFHGFGVHLWLGPGTDPGADPLAIAAWELVAGLAPLRPGEHLRVIRSWMGLDEGYHLPGITNSALTAAVARRVLVERGLAATVAFAVGEATWSALYGYADYGRAAGGDVQIPGTSETARAFLHDWRVCPPADWLDLLDARLVGPGDPAGAGGADQAAGIRTAVQHAQRHVQGAAFVALTQQQFAAAVRDALRNARNPADLAGSPLLATPLVRHRSQAATGTPTDLRDCLVEQVALLQTHSPTAGRAVELVYLGPRRTQQAAAARMGLPFSTFRRHLATGVQQVAEAMWQARG